MPLTRPKQRPGATKHRTSAASKRQRPIAAERPQPANAKDQKSENPSSKPKVGVPRLKVSGNRIDLLHPDHAEACKLLGDAIGAKDLDFTIEFLKQLGEVSSDSQNVSETAINFLLSVVKEGKPKDQLHAMLLAQMGAVHSCVMYWTRRAKIDVSPYHVDIAVRAATKFAQVFAAQVETSKRYQSTGEQKITVNHNHVAVSDGGQAIVGTVMQNASKDKKRVPSPPALTQSKEAPMTIIEAKEETVVVPRRKMTQNGSRSKPQLN